MNSDDQRGITTMDRSIKTGRLTAPRLALAVTTAIINTSMNNINLLKRMNIFILE